MKLNRRKFLRAASGLFVPAICGAQEMFINPYRFSAAGGDVTDGLVARWKLDDNMLDSVGSFNGAASDATWGSGKDGNCIICGGTSTAATLAASSGLITNNDSWSVVFWFKRPSSSTARMLVFMRDSSTGSSLIFYASGSFLAWGSAATSFTIYGSFTNDAWWHVVMTFDGDYYTPTINGDTQTPTAPTGTPSGFGSGTAVISQSGNVFSGGMIDDLRIYNRPISEPEAQTIYTATGGT